MLLLLSLLLSHIKWILAWFVCGMSDINEENGVWSHFFSFIYSLCCIYTIRSANTFPKIMLHALCIQRARYSPIDTFISYWNIFQLRHVWSLFIDNLLFSFIHIFFFSSPIYKFIYVILFYMVFDHCNAVLLACVDRLTNMLIHLCLVIICNVYVCTHIYEYSERKKLPINVRFWP